MIYIIIYLVLVLIVGGLYHLVKKNYLSSKIQDVYFKIEHIGFYYIGIIYSHWRMLYKKDAETKKLLFGGRSKFFAQKEHTLGDIAVLYKSYDFDYLEKLFGGKFAKDEYKNFEQEIGMIASVEALSSALRSILLVITLGIAYFVVGDKKYC